MAAGSSPARPTKREHSKMTNEHSSELLALEIPDLNQEQIAEFRRENLRSIEVGGFDPASALSSLISRPGLRAIGIDIGGDKSLTQLFSVSRDGNLQPDDSFKDLQKDNRGEGYVVSMEKTAEFAAKNKLPIGISMGIPLDGTKPKDPKKLPVMVDDLDNLHGGDFAKLFADNKLKILNDGPAGLVSGAIRANISNPGPITNVIFAINGGGIGAAVLKDSRIYSSEPGHIRLIDELDRYPDERQCGVFGATYKCVEQAASNKNGIEPIWEAKTGEALSALEIERKFTGQTAEGKLSLELYSYSALIEAHVIKGVAQAFKIDLSSPETAVVGHGGTFKFPGYGARVAQILAKNGDTIQLMLTKDYSHNACAEGAAIAALT